MRVAVLFSGGKDSVFATFWAIMQGFDVTLVTVRPPEYSMMFHHPNIDATKKQADALGLEQIIIEASEENWREKLIRTFQSIRAQGIVAGAIASEYQRRRIDSIGEELGIPTYAPLWHKDMGEALMAEMLGYFEIYVTAVSAEGLGPEFLGEPLKKLIDAKKRDIHPFLEGGEGETFVTDAPFFKKRLVIGRFEKSFDGSRGIANIASMKTIAKGPKTGMPIKKCAAPGKR